MESSLPWQRAKCREAVCDSGGVRRSSLIRMNSVQPSRNSAGPPLSQHASVVRRRHQPDVLVVH